MNIVKSKSGSPVAGSTLVTCIVTAAFADPDKNS